MPADTYSNAELESYRSVQQLAYTCTVEVARGLTAGVTEREAVRRLRKALADRGVREYFHRPLAWFGERTTFDGFRTPMDFMATDKRLEPGMVAILDVAPVVDGKAADIGYSFSLGDSPELAAALRDLREFRQLVLEQVKAGRTMLQIYGAVDQLLQDLGYRNCHHKYPFGVLAHRIPRLSRNPRLHRIGVGFAFTLNALVTTLKQELRSAFGRSGEQTPFWNAKQRADRPPERGIFAVEPHIAKGGIGAKWEEQLVITDQTAYWLDDNLPHVVSQPTAWRPTAIAG